MKSITSEFFRVTTWSRRLSAGTVDEVMTRAFSEWQKYADLEFRRAHDPVFDLKFGVGSHHCEYPFSSTILAHAFGPRGASFEADEDPSGIIGDIHFNDDVPWSAPLLLATSIHEIGHALGLPHVGDVNSIMYPILVEGQQFTPRDIYTIQRLYGPPATKGTSSERDKSSGNRATDHSESEEHNEDIEDETTSEPQPCTSEVDAVTTFRGEFIVFKNKWLWRVVNDGQGIYGPNLISDIFPGLPEKIDAAVEIEEQIWIFSGKQYWIFSKRLLLSGPQPLTTLGLPENLRRIRLAYKWHYFDPPATYLWAEHDYWKLDVKSRRVEDSYARRISLNWRHVPPRATAAFSRDKELYFMQDDLVYKMNTSDYRLPIARGYPVPISKYWPFCSEEKQSLHYVAAQINSSTVLFIPFVYSIVVLVFPS